MGNNPISGFDPNGGLSFGGGENDPPMKYIPTVFVTAKATNKWYVSNTFAAQFDWSVKNIDQKINVSKLTTNNSPKNSGWGSASKKRQVGIV